MIILQQMHHLRSETQNCIDNKLLEQLKTGFKIITTWKKYRSEISNQTANNQLNYLTDPTFTNVNRLFVLFFDFFQNII